jgi:hypothetical protein
MGSSPVPVEATADFEQAGGNSEHRNPLFESRKKTFFRSLLDLGPSRCAPIVNRPCIDRVLRSVEVAIKGFYQVNYHLSHYYAQWFLNIPPHAHILSFVAVGT